MLAPAAGTRNLTGQHENKNEDCETPQPSFLSRPIEGRMNVNIIMTVIIAMAIIKTAQQPDSGAKHVQMK